MNLASEEAMPGAREVSDAPLSLEALYAAEGRFVWSSLARLGVAAKDLEDQLQEVFVVVHRQHTGFRGDAAVRTWLFQICRRVAANYRKRASTRREELFTPTSAEPRAPEGGPERAAMEGEARGQLLAMLEEMDMDKRAVFVMFEVELMPALEIAAIVGAPLATVYSRLAAARKIFDRGVERLQRTNDRAVGSRSAR